jgi:glycosyltransferase involved in cell wall biosynthesis
MTRPPLRIVHVIGGLHVGGAELSLLRLVRHLQGHGVDTCVISLGGRREPLVAAFEQSGVTVACCDIRANPPTGLVRLVRGLRALRPDVVHGWMYHGYVAAVVASRLARVRARLVWGVRHSLDARRRETWLTRCWIASGSWRVMAPDIVVFNSESGRRTHQFWPHRNMVIPNGVDTTRFGPRFASDRARGASLTIGHIARYHPMKGTHVFLDAMARIALRVPGLRIILIGEGMVGSNAELVEAIASRGLGHLVTLKGGRDADARDYHQLDMVVSASLYGEGTPNVVLESMACAVPVVASDVGDSALLLGDTRWLAPPGDAVALAARCLSMFDLGIDGRRRLGAALRDRAKACFSEDRCVRAYMRMYAELCPLPTWSPPVASVET